MQCPNCGCSFAVPKSKNAGEKMLTDDRAKAWRAIEVLDRFLLAGAEPAYLLEAIESERDRLIGALDEPAVLWAIYRRAEKKPSYAPTQFAVAA
jgi:hypothetical protein